MQYLQIENLKIFGGAKREKLEGGIFQNCHKNSRDFITASLKIQANKNFILHRFWVKSKSLFPNVELLLLNWFILFVISQLSWLSTALLNWWAAKGLQEGRETFCYKLKMLLEKIINYDS